jgi:hypothetical protein
MACAKVTEPEVEEEENTLMALERPKVSIIQLM